MRLTLKGVKRYFSALRRLESWGTVCIWSGEHRGYWGSERAGYFPARCDAGIYTGAQAYNCTSHCGPEKKISYEKVSMTLLALTPPIPKEEA